MNTNQCIVCGAPFPQFSEPSQSNNHGRSTRKDRKTCSATCRKRWQRGTLKRSFKSRPGWG